MSITRSELKEIVKECLREILAEGLGDAVSASSSAPDHRESRFIEEATKAKPRTRLAPPKPVQQTPRSSPTRPVPSQAGISKLEASVINETFSKISAGGVNMAEIFADTAATTYREQPQGVSAVSADPIARAIADKDPLDLFGDAAKNWEEIAFR